MHLERQCSGARVFMGYVRQVECHKISGSTKGVMDRWLARFAMSFFIIAAVLVWSAYQALQHHAALWRIAMDLFAAAAAVAMGVVGTREKHRRS
jgi:hypothetical protein